MDTCAFANLWFRISTLWREVQDADPSLEQARQDAWPTSAARRQKALGVLLDADTMLISLLLVSTQASFGKSELAKLFSVMADDVEKAEDAARHRLGAILDVMAHPYGLFSVVKPEQPGERYDIKAEDGLHALVELMKPRFLSLLGEYSLFEFDADSVRDLEGMAREHNRSMQDLLREAIDDLSVKLR